jgi:hypothetical protein
MDNLKLSISRKILNRFKNQSYCPIDLPPGPNFEWIQTQSKLPWLKLDITIPTDFILDEIKKIQNLLIPHREDYNEHSGWESFCIHGRGYAYTREDEKYNTTLPDYHWTDEAVSLMPFTVNYFRTQWPGSCYRRIRVMKLAPGGHITVHKDSDDSRLTAINIAITQPAECYFVIEKFGRVPFSIGSAFWLDLSNRHVVFNDSDQDRWHIIVHQETNQTEFQNLVAKSYSMLYNQTNENRNNNNQRRS